MRCSSSFRRGLQTTSPAESHDMHRQQAHLLRLLVGALQAAGCEQALLQGGVRDDADAQVCALCDRAVPLWAPVQDAVLDLRHSAPCYMS